MCWRRSGRRFTAMSETGCPPCPTRSSADWSPCSTAYSGAWANRARRDRGLPSPPERTLHLAIVLTLQGRLTLLIFGLAATQAELHLRQTV